MTTTETLQVGFVPIARTTFDMKLAEEITGRARLSLERSGFTLIAPDRMITDEDEMSAVIDLIARHAPDLLIIFQATFADSAMLTQLAERIAIPLLLWAVPEAHTGERLRLNSLCGINLGAHALTRRGIPYQHLYADPCDQQSLKNVTAVAKAAHVRKLLQRARLGRAGENPSGFDTCELNQEALRERLGVEVTQIDLRQEVFARMRQVEGATIQEARNALSARVVGLNDVESKAANGTLSAYVALHEIAREQKIDGFAARCWPEFFTEMGCAACGALAMLSDEMTPCSCEADVNGTVTQLILQWLSDEPAFGADIVSIDREMDALVLWHCGLAPLSMADPQTKPGVTVHSNRRLPLLMEFALKPGPVTLARLSAATGEYRLVIGKGEMLRGVKRFSGTSGLLRFERPANVVMDTILSEGLEHHISLTYGDHVPALLALAQMLNLPVLHL